jgi:hypothetical protein
MLKIEIRPIPYPNRESGRNKPKLHSTSAHANREHLLSAKSEAIWKDLGIFKNSIKIVANSAP